MVHSQIRKFESCLHRLVKMDYGFELYNYNENFIRFSFYHLNSVYNAFCWCNLHTDPNNCYFDWQYANKSKQIAEIVEKIVCFIRDYYQEYHNYDKILDIVNYYNSLANKVFEAKYSTNVALNYLV